MQETLRDVAAAVAASDLTAWWSAPLDRAAQWNVVFDDPLRTSPQAVGPAAEQLACWRADAVQEQERARLERPTDPRARWSGSWWSVPPSDLPRTTRSLGGLGLRGELGPAGLYLVEDSFGPERATVRPVAVPDHAAVYEIDGPQAWAELCRRFPLEVTASRRHDWYRTTGEAVPWAIPDWSRVAEAVDGVHLTVNGYLTTAGRPVEVSAGTRSVLAGWNPDETYWLRSELLAVPGRVVEGDRGLDGPLGERALAEQRPDHVRRGLEPVVVEREPDRERQPVGEHRLRGEAAQAALAEVDGLGGDPFGQVRQQGADPVAIGPLPRLRGQDVEVAADLQVGGHRPGHADEPAALLAAHRAGDVHPPHPQAAGRRLRGLERAGQHAEPSRGDPLQGALGVGLRVLQIAREPGRGDEVRERCLRAPVVGDVLDPGRDLAGEPDGVRVVDRAQGDLDEIVDLGRPDHPRQWFQHHRDPPPGPPLCRPGRTPTGLPTYTCSDAGRAS